jgi:hypothetical protein
MADILALLRNEHALMRSQLRLLAMDGVLVGEPHADIYSRLSSMIRLHSHFEEDVLYPLLARSRDYQDVVTAAYLDHDRVNHLISEARSIDPTGARWAFMLTELELSLDHHITIEEAIVMPELEVVIHVEERHELGHRYEEWSWTSVVGPLARPHIPQLATRASPAESGNHRAGQGGTQGTRHSPVAGA